MLDADVIGAKPEIPRTSTNPFLNPAIDNTAFEPELPNSSLLTRNLTDTSVFTVPSHTPSQPLPDLFTTPYARDEAASTSPSLIVNSSPNNKVKNSIFSRFRLNKAVDKLAKTPNKGRNTHQSKQPQSPPFLARLSSRLSSANTSTNTSQPIGHPKVTSSPRLFAGRKKIPKSTAAPKTLPRQLFNCMLRQPQPFHSPASSTFVAPTTSAPSANMTTNNSQVLHCLALADFQKDLHIRNSLQALPPFTGNSLSRFDSWLESFESIIQRSNLSEDEAILELQGKLTDKAHKVIKYIVDNNPKEYDAIKEKLLDHFHGDETVEKYVKKFNKAHRKPGEKISDFAIRLQDIFKHAYPDSHAEDSFKVILKEKFIEGLDEKLQLKVKYKDYDTFDELVAATRKYSTRMEPVENSRENHEFVNAINQTSESHTILEMKKLMEKQNETIIAMAKLAEAVKNLVRREEQPFAAHSQHHPQQAAPWPPSQHPFNSESHTPRQSYGPATHTFEETPPSYDWTTGQQYEPQAPTPPIPEESDQLQKICYFCGETGHTQITCYKKRQTEYAESPICCLCRQMGHKSHQCPNNNHTLEFPYTHVQQTM